MSVAAHFRGFRYFSNEELRDLFAVDEAGLNSSETSAQLAALHGAERAYAPEVTEHLAEVRRIPHGTHCASIAALRVARALERLFLP